MFEKFKKKHKEEKKVESAVPETVKNEQTVENIQTKAPGSPQVVILVDANNVAYGNSQGSKGAMLGNVIKALDTLNGTGSRILAIADATLRHNIDNKDSFEKMMSDGQVMQVPAASSADDYIWEIAQHHLKKGNKVYVVTNDRFPITKATTAESKNIRRISFMFVDSDIFFQPNLNDLVKPTNHNDQTQQKTAEPPVKNVPSERKPKDSEAAKKPRQVKKDMEIPPELLSSLVTYIGSRNPPVKIGDPINFASVSNFLHKKYGGDFCATFGFRRPKDFANLLERDGFAKLSHQGTTLYIEPTEKLLPSVQ